MTENKLRLVKQTAKGLCDPI